MDKKYRDSFFRFYFLDKVRLLSLCNALTGEDSDNPDEIKINTLEETFFSKRKNDISCEYRGRQLILIEHQTTLNENMPLRFLLYYVKLLDKIHEKEFSGKLYAQKPIKLLRPEFYVLYNGFRAAEEYREMRLSDSFKEFTDSLELKAKFYNINHPYNKNLIEKSESLEDYCVFVERVKSNKQTGMNDKEAFYEAYKYCMSARASMRKFLEEHEWELNSMIITEYNEQWAMDAAFNDGLEEGLEKGIEKGIEQGIEQGRAEKTLEMVRNLLKVKTPIEYIVAATGWSEEKILRLAEN